MQTYRFLRISLLLFFLFPFSSVKSNQGICHHVNLFGLGLSLHSDFLTLTLFLFLFDLFSWKENRSNKQWGKVYIDHADVWWKTSQPWRIAFSRHHVLPSSLKANDENSSEKAMQTLVWFRITVHRVSMSGNASGRAVVISHVIFSNSSSTTFSTTCSLWPLQSPSHCHSNSNTYTLSRTHIHTHLHAYSYAVEIIAVLIYWAASIKTHEHIFALHESNGTMTIA